MGRSSPEVLWSEPEQGRTVALNVAWRYVNVAVELLIGLVMLPLNARYLGASDYGLWMLAASMVAYFPVLDLGYGGAMERFVAHYRVRRDPGAINEIASTLLALFAGLAVLGFLVLATLAFNLDTFFKLGPEQARTGTIVMLCVSAQVAAGLPFVIYGAIVNAFQRTYRNAAVGLTITTITAIVNVSIVLSGGTLVQLVAATALVKMVGYIAYRYNAHFVFPLLRPRLSMVRRERLREVTGFSVYMLIQDLSAKLNYATDPIVIAAVMSTGAVAVWTVAQRLADVVLQLTNQLNYTLFPIVVESDTSRNDVRLRALLVEGTRLSLAASLPVAGSMALLANSVVIGWAGPDFASAAGLVRLLAVVVVVRIGSWTASTVLYGAGHHKLLALSNLTAAVCNVALSVVFIRLYGLPGMAVATLVPVTVRAATVVVPAACRRVGISISRFLAEAVWPAVWPAGIALGALAAMVHDTGGMTLLRAVLTGAAAGLFYLLLFLGIAISRTERERYVGRLRSLTGRPALNAA